MIMDEDDLLRKVKVLNETIWEDRAGRPEVGLWLGNFKPDAAEPERCERLHALYLLSQFMYFGAREIRELLHALYRDLYRYPLVESIRRANADTLDSDIIENEFRDQLFATRFVGVGNPAESGTHLLYYFRQENRLGKKLFVHSHEIFRRRGGMDPVQLRDPTIRRYVFIDDFCGSGDQAVDYSDEIVQDIKALDPDVEVCYYMLFATRDGRKRAKDNTLFDRVDCVLELDGSFKCFAGDCRYFLAGCEPLGKDFAHQMCLDYGDRLCPGDPLGYGDCQLMIGFHHNTPDNTLPIFWYDESEGEPWRPIFRRYPKAYGWGLL